jgi:hypothetical protein
MVVAPSPTIQACPRRTVGSDALWRYAPPADRLKVQVTVANPALVAQRIEHLTTEHVQLGAVRIVETPGRLTWGFVCRAHDQMLLFVAENSA